MLYGWQRLVTPIIDCTELFKEMPSSFHAQVRRICHKSHNTAKGLIAIAPSEIVTFISCLYGGHMSDKKIARVWPYPSS